MIGYSSPRVPKIGQEDMYNFILIRIIKYWNYFTGKLKRSRGWAFILLVIINNYAPGREYIVDAMILRHPIFVTVT